MVGLPPDFYVHWFLYGYHRNRIRYTRRFSHSPLVNYMSNDFMAIVFLILLALSYTLQAVVTTFTWYTGEWVQTNITRSLRITVGPILALGWLYFQVIVFKYLITGATSAYAAM
jgi:hypothetical protein